MAVMSDTERAEGYAEWMRNPIPGYPFVNLKAELRAAFDAADQWMEDNKESYNSALPVAFRTAASARAKAYLLARVLNKRFDLGLF